MTTHSKQGKWLFITFAAAAVLMITMGARQTLGLFVFPINNSTGLGLVTISFALAVGQFIWGAIQPLAGAVADRYGPGRVLVGGVLILALGSALTPFLTTGLGLVTAIGFLSAIGSGAASFSVLIGAVAQRISASHRGSAAGVINAGGSFGQFVFAPLLQKLISLFGWMGAMWSLALITLLALPLVQSLRAPRPAGHAGGGAASGAGSLRMAVRRALSRGVGRYAFARGSEPSGTAAPRGQLVPGDHRIRQHLRQPRRRLVRQSLPEQICTFLRLRCARAAGIALLGGAQERVDILSLRRGPRFNLVGNRSAHRGSDR